MWSGGIDGGLIRSPFFYRSELGRRSISPHPVRLVVGSCAGYRQHDIISLFAMTYGTPCRKRNRFVRLSDRSPCRLRSCMPLGPRNFFVDKSELIGLRIVHLRKDPQGQLAFAKANRSGNTSAMVSATGQISGAKSAKSLGVIGPGLAMHKYRLQRGQNGDSAE